VEELVAGNNQNQTPVEPDSLEITILLFSVFIVGLCTIIYELLIGSVSSYFLGDSVKQFSLTIGFTMTAMGLGTFLSRLIKNHLITWFILVEVILGLIGGLSVPFLFAAYSVANLYYPVMLALIMIIGVLIGLELPLLTRILEKHYKLRSNISNVLSADYFGAFAATLLFPFVLLPFLGIFKSSLITGLINILIGVANLWFFRHHYSKFQHKKLIYICLAISFTLCLVLIASQKLIHTWESSIYEDRIIFSKQTSYQKIVLTKNNNDLRLYLDGNLQFSAIDEYRYHESLVHIPFALLPHRKEILILGGGDGLAVKEILKYPGVDGITVVDLDPEITILAQNHPMLLKLNQQSLKNPKVKIINQDAYKFIEESENLYDCIISDLPDPKNNSLARLYSREFYKLVKKRLTPAGIFISQSTSCYFAAKAFQCIGATMKSAGFKSVIPYHAYVPAFGDWGFYLASRFSPDIDKMVIKVETKFLDPESKKALFHFPKDLKPENIKSSSLNNPVILEYYLEGWKHWN
jgi:spermidine synthase